MKPDQVSVQIWMSTTGWQMQIVGKGGSYGRGHYPEIPVPFSHQADVTFQIIRTPQASFSTNVPFCAQANVTQPTVCDTVFTPGAGGRQQLTVHDANPVKQVYNYVLNFDNNYPPLDPIFNNGGNGKTGGFTSTSTLLIAMAVMLALIIGLIFAWRGGPARR